MASLESIAPDQRAVLQMVLGRGRGYDQIAQMLSIDRQGVRTRALAALDALGPGTGVPAERRSEITDYLLGQLDASAALRVWDSLANTPSERAWARVVASELTPLAAHPLPEIPVSAERREPEPVAAEAQPERVAEPIAAGREAELAGPPPTEPESHRGPEPAPAEPAAAEDSVPPGAAGDAGGGQPGSPPPRRRVSRLGGAVLLGAVGVIVAVVVVILVVSGSGSKNHSASKAAASPAAQSTPSSSAATSTAATPVAQINLLSPTGSKSTAGIAEVLRQGSTTAVAIVGQGLAANTKHDAYAVWLYNSPGDAKRLGFVNPGVGKNGRLETTGPLPSNASHFKQLLISLETKANPTSPGHIVLQGALTGV